MCVFVFFVCYAPDTLLINVYIYIYTYIIFNIDIIFNIAKHSHSHGSKANPRKHAGLYPAHAHAKKLSSHANERGLPLDDRESKIKAKGPHAGEPSTEHTDEPKEVLHTGARSRVDEDVFHRAVELDKHLVHEILNEKLQFHFHKSKMVATNAPFQKAFGDKVTKFTVFGSIVLCPAVPQPKHTISYSAVSI